MLLKRGNMKKIIIALILISGLAIVILASTPEQKYINLPQNISKLYTSPFTPFFAVTTSDNTTFFYLESTLSAKLTDFEVSDMYLYENRGLIINSSGDVYNLSIKNDTVDVQKITRIENAIQCCMYDNSFAVITSDGGLYVWGNNKDSQLGVRNIEHISSPIKVDYISNALNIFMSEDYSLVLLKSWEVLQSGRLYFTDNSTRNNRVFSIVEDLSDANLIKISNNRKVFVTKNNDVKYFCYLNGIFSLESPLQKENITDIGVSDGLISFLNEDGEVFAMAGGRVDSTQDIPFYAEKVQGLENIESIYCNNNNTLFAKKQDKLYVIRFKRSIFDITK